MLNTWISLYWVFFVFVTEWNDDTIIKAAVKIICVYIEVLLCNYVLRSSFERVQKFNKPNFIILNFADYCISKLNYLIIWRYFNSMQIKGILYRVWILNWNLLCNNLVSLVRLAGETIFWKLQSIFFILQCNFEYKWYFFWQW